MMTASYTKFRFLVGIWFLCLTVLEPVNGKVDSKFKFGPLHPPHDRTIISDFDTYAIHYCGLRDSLFEVAHCIFHAFVEVLEEREVKYEDYEGVIGLLLRGKNLDSHQKLISSVNSCESLVVPYIQFTKPKSSKSIMGVKFSTKIEDYCKFAYRCIVNGPSTLIKEKESAQQKYLGRWMSTYQGSEGFGKVLASRLDFQISKLKIRSKEPGELSQIANKLAAQSPAKRESLCLEILKNKELCSIVAPFRPAFVDWLHSPIDPVKNAPFKFNPQTMIDEKIKSIVNIQINEELPLYCIPQEIFSFKPSPEQHLNEKKRIHLYTDFSPQEKAIINQFLMHFVINYGKVPRVIFDNRSRFAIEGWLSHKNKFPIVAVHNSMYSLGRKLQYKDAMSGMLYSNSGSKKETYPYNLPQFKIFSVYSDKTRNFEISDTNPLISTCLKEGCAYYIGRSASMSPVLVIRASTIISNRNFKQSSASFLSMFLMAFAERYLFFPGKVETIDIIIDCRGFSLNNFSTLLRIRPIIMYWQEEGIINQYPLRFSNIFIIQQSDIWSTLKDILGRFWLNETIKNIQVISNVSNNPKDNPDLKLLWRHMSPHIIETDMGGVRPKIRHGEFYPFKILPGPYRPFNSNLLSAQVSPSLSDWPKPDLDSPKNLHKLIPQSLFSLGGKTLDGNDQVVPINWKELGKLLESIPKSLWPDMTAPASGPKAEQDPEAAGSKSTSVPTDDSLPREEEPASGAGVRSTQDSDPPGAPSGAGAKAATRPEQGPILPIDLASRDKRGRDDLLVRLSLTQRVLHSLRQLQALRLYRTRSRRSLAEKCTQLAAGHASLFSGLVSRTLAEASRQNSATKSRGWFLGEAPQANGRLSVLEAYSDIVSNLKFGEARTLLLTKSSPHLDKVESQLSALETRLDQARREIRGLVADLEGQDSLEERVASVWAVLMSVFRELGQLREEVGAAELGERRQTLRLQRACERLTSSLSVTRSFLDSYGKYDRSSMLESSLLVSIVDAIIRGQEQELELELEKRKSKTTATKSTTTARK